MYNPNSNLQVATMRSCFSLCIDWTEFMKITLVLTTVPQTVLFPFYVVVIL